MRSTLFHRVGLDAAIATLLFGAAYLCGTAYVRTAMAAGVVPDFYQVHFAPAVMVACGRGYVSPPSGEVPALDMFLATQRSTFECADLPAHPRLAKLTGPQVTWRYLISTAGLIWRATSVSWSELVLTFSGVLVAATVALAYALARLSVGRVLAIFVAGAVLSSPLHLTTLLYLRDYSKAPFLTALWVLLGALVAAPLSVGGTLASKRVLALAAVYGLVLAIGSGFRNDVLIAAPPFVLAIAFLPGGIFANFALKVEALAIAAATFLLAAWPLLGAYTAGGGASMQHVALLGLMANFNESLDVAPSVYELGHTYDDSLVTVIITNYAVRRQHVNEPIADYDHRYDTAASAVIRNVITTFPGDILARAYASAFTIATLPTSHFAEGRPPQFLPRGSAIERWYQLRSRVLHAVPWIWSVFVVLALLLACASSVRVAIFVALAGLYFAGYPAIQFHGRHYFHLSVLTPLAVAFVIHRMMALIRPPLAAARQSTRGPGSTLARVAAFAGGAVVMIAAPLALARAYQDRRVAVEIERRLEAARQPLQLAMRESKGHTALDVTNLPGQEDAERMPGTTRAEYLVARLGGRRCESASVALRLQYDEPLDEREGFSRTMAVGIPLDESHFTTILVPVFFRFGGGDTVRFRGFEVPRGDERCIEQISRIVDPGQFEILFTATLSPEWRARPLHQTIAAMEHGFLDHEPDVVAMPQDLRLPRRLLAAPVAEADTIIRAKTIRRTPAGTWTMNAEAESPFAELLYFEPVQLRADGRFIVQGFLRSGGLFVAVVQDAEGRPRPRPEALNDRLLVQAKVTEPGPFVVVLATTAAGPGCLVVANHRPRSSQKNDFEISRAGWLVADAAHE